MKKKVVLIQGLLAPYRYPIFAELAKKSDWDFEVWFMGKNVKNRIWGEEAIKKYNFNYRFLDGITFNFGKKDNFPFWVNLGVRKLLSKEKPDAVIMMGWDSLTSFLVHIACKVLGVKFVLYSDSTSMENSWRRVVTLPIVKLHVGSADTLIAGGTRGRIYLENLGADPNNIFVSYNTVDIEKYQRLTNKFKEFSAETRKSLNVGNKKVILYYAQLIERKGGDLLLLAYKKLKEKHKDIALVVIGDGIFRNNLEEIIKKKELKNVVILADPGDEEICRFYAIADIFVLPSREDVWGLVVNEAMASGLPVVVSDKAGSSVDLVHEGFNGFTFKSGSVRDMASKIDKILTDANLRNKMSENSQLLIRLFSPKLTVQKFTESVEKTFVDGNTEIDFVAPQTKGMLSVIIPVRGDKAGLKKTIDSLNQQDFDKSKFEIVIGNDEWGDSSYKARNEAIRKSKGEFAAFIDAGSIAGPGWMENGTRGLTKYDYIGGPVEVVKEDSSTIPDWLYSFERNREFPVSEFMKSFHFSPTTNLFVRRSLIEKLGGFDERLSSSGDYEYGDRVFRSEGFSQFFDPGLKVNHSARSYKAMVDKQRRLAKGFVDLGRFYPDRFPFLKFNIFKPLLKMIYPPFWLLNKENWHGLSLKEKMEVFYGTYLFSMIQHSKSIRYGFLHGR